MPYIMEEKLFEAISQKSFKLARMLVEGEGVNVNCTNKDGETPLLMVCEEKTDGDARRQQHSLIKALLDKNANLFIRDKYGRTSLTCAYMNRDKYILELMLFHTEKHSFSFDSSSLEYKSQRKSCVFF